MNPTSNVLAGLVLGSALLVGCEERPEARPVPERTTPTTPTTTTPPPTTPGTTNQDSQAKAQSLILKFHQQLDAGDYTAAEATLRELESMRSSLPRATQQEIDQLRDTLRQRQGTAPTTPPTTEPATPPGS